MRFYTEQSLGDLQEFIKEVYSLPDDRLYSLEDLLNQVQRFAMRSLKGIRKGDTEKIKKKLLISIMWTLAISNRLHIDLEEEVWIRFPMLCSYCGNKPCICKKAKVDKRQKVKVNDSSKPKSLSGFQHMFDAIYPRDGRTIVDAGIHLAEEVGEVSEAVHNYIGQHLQKQFEEVKLEIADLISCACGIANSLNIDLGAEFAKILHDNCHVCHTLPCSCSFTTIALLKN